MRFFPVAFTTNSAGFLGVAFSKLQGSSVIWGTEYQNRRKKREREIKQSGDRSHHYVFNADVVHMCSSAVVLLTQATVMIKIFHYNTVSHFNSYG